MTVAVESSGATFSSRNPIKVFDTKYATIAYDARRKTVPHHQRERNRRPNSRASQRGRGPQLDRRAEASGPDAVRLVVGDGRPRLHPQVSMRPRSEKRSVSTALACRLGGNCCRIVPEGKFATHTSSFQICL
jgi:hypothetical protein